MTLLESLREHLIREVFAPAIAHKPASIATVEHFGGDMRFADGDLLFTLPQLFAFVLADFERNPEAGYSWDQVKEHLKNGSWRTA